MANRYTATAQLRFRKQHTCASCGCVYSYLMERKIAGTGSTADGASADMQQNGHRVMRDQNQLHPCPNCGQFQEDMIGLRMAKRRQIVAFLAVLMPILVPVLYTNHDAQTFTLSWIVFFYCAAVLGVHFLLNLYNPNRDREANRGTAANRIVDGTLHVKPMATTPEPDTPALARPTQSRLHLATMIVLLGAAPLALAPELVRIVRGWPLNDQCHPPVVDATEATRVSMDHTITSVNGYWRGNPIATCQTAEGGAPIPLEARTNQNDWGAAIYVNSEHEQSYVSPWVEVTFPEKADLVGKTLICHVYLDIQYPKPTGVNTFYQAADHMQRDFSICLAPRGASAQYSSLWWTCTMAALLVDFAGSIALLYAARMYQRKARPTTVMPPNQT